MPLNIVDMSARSWKGMDLLDLAIVYDNHRDTSSLTFHCIIHQHNGVYMFSALFHCSFPKITDSK